MGSGAVVIPTKSDPSETEGRAPELALADLDARLDEALRETFPASDPIAVSTSR